MALSPQALIKGIVSRALPSINADGFNTDVAIRQHSYGEVMTMPVVRKAHVLADEGSYWNANNGTTATASAYNTAYTATAPYVLIYNGSASSRLYVDAINISTAVSGTITVAGYMAAALVLDAGNRYASGGTLLAPTNANPAAPSSALAGVSVYLAPTAAAATTNARTLVGQRAIRPSNSTTNSTIAGDQFIFNFGGVEGAAAGTITAASANIMPVPMPPLVIPPGYSGLLYLTYVGETTAAAATFFAEVNFWVR